MDNFDHVSARTTQEAVELLRDSGTDPGRRPKIIAGGTDLLDEMKEGLIAPRRLVNIKENGNLRFVRFDRAEGLRVGALTTLAELENHADLHRHYPAIATALGTIASPQIRNRV